MSSIFQIILVGYIHPYQEKRHNQQEINNEIATIFIMYHIFCFTDWVSDADVKYNLGFSCLFFNFASLGYNIVMLLGFQFIDVRRKFKLAQIKYRFLKNRK